MDFCLDRVSGIKDGSPFFLQRRKFFAEHLRDDIFLAGKVIKESALGDINLFGDILNRGVLKTLFSKQLLSGAQDGIACCFLFLLSQL